MRSANIKNLSIALECLQRFPSMPRHTDAIRELLEKEISLMQEEQYPPEPITPTRKPIDTEDEIPF